MIKSLREYFLKKNKLQLLQVHELKITDNNIIALNYFVMHFGLFIHHYIGSSL